MYDKIQKQKPRLLNNNHVSPQKNWIFTTKALDRKTKHHISLIQPKCRSIEFGDDKILKKLSNPAVGIGIMNPLRKSRPRRFSCSYSTICNNNQDFIKIHTRETTKLSKSFSFVYFSYNYWIIPSDFTSFVIGYGIKELLHWDKSLHT